MKRIEKLNVSVPVIVQNVGGDLNLRGREGGLLLVDGEGPHVEHIGEGQPYLVRCDGDCRITVPDDVDVVVQNVGGDCRVTDVGGSTAVDTVGGDLLVRHVGGAQIKTVGGDLRLKWADGGVHVQAVGGDATVREIDGDVMLQAVGADVYIRGVDGACVIENAGADIVLNMVFEPEREYRFRAGSDILCRIQPENGVRFVVPADTNVGLDVDANIIEDEESDLQIVTVGDGSALVTIMAGDELRLVGQEDDYVVDLGAQIEEEVEGRLRELEVKLGLQLEGMDERIQAGREHFAEQASRFIERAAREAERQSERATREAERQVKRQSKRIRRNLERRSSKNKRDSGSWPSFTWGFPPDLSTTPRPPAEPVSEEERLMILRMVQENKITIEEAERLLAALEQQD